MIAIVNYGVGNLLSVKDMLSRAGCRDVVISARPDEISAASKLILPGVKHETFATAAKQIGRSEARKLLDRVFASVGR